LGFLVHCDREQELPKWKADVSADFVIMNKGAEKYKRSITATVSQDNLHFGNDRLWHFPSIANEINGFVDGSK
ncbi:hypothetical protein PFISCL1PPCAC_21572, partial [Pristionchus fissidentatus]